MLNVLIETIRTTFAVSVFVFVTMLVVDYMNVLTRGSLSGIMKKGRVFQYVSASFLGATPGCLGAFMVVSFYQHGLISFGATFGCMVATCGDEAYVMLASFPGRALMLFGILFVMGIGFGWLSDVLGPLFGPGYAQGCKVEAFHSDDECCRFDGRQIWRQIKGMSLARGLILIVFAGAIVAAAIGLLEERWEKTTGIILVAVGLVIVGTTPDHYLGSHVVGHIVKKHLWKVVLWTFFALMAIGIALEYWDIESFVKQHKILLLLVAAVVGLIPQSGPHLIFVTMFAKGLIPFSVLLTNSIVQEGHGLLPLLSCSVRDALTVKGAKLIIGIAVGFIVYALGW